MKDELRPEIRFWELAFCAALTGLIAEGNTAPKDEITYAAVKADLALAEWDKRVGKKLT